MDNCVKCGGMLVGDGHAMPRHCEYAEVPEDVEPDAPIVFCNFEEPENESTNHGSNKMLAGHDWESHGANVTVNDVDCRVLTLMWCNCQQQVKTHSWEQIGNGI
jgi:hypothetical protein